MNFFGFKKVMVLFISGYIMLELNPYLEDIYTFQFFECEVLHLQNWVLWEWHSSVHVFKCPSLI